MDKSLLLAFLTVCACCTSPNSKAEDGSLYGISTLNSLHQDRESHYNEKNYGIGGEFHVSQDFRLVFGEYKNSFKNKSEYFGSGYLPFHRNDFSAGFLIVGINGYNFKDLKKFELVAVPVVSYEKEKFLLNFVFIPPVFNAGVIALQAGWRFK